MLQHLNKFLKIAFLVLLVSWSQSTVPTLMTRHQLLEFSLTGLWNVELLLSLPNLPEGASPREVFFLLGDAFQMTCTVPIQGTHVWCLWPTVLFKINSKNRAHCLGSPNAKWRWSVNVPNPWCTQPGMLRTAWNDLGCKFKLFTIVNGKITGFNQYTIDYW